MPRTIWGFNLSEARWSAFIGKNMYDKRWPHLRRERLIAYQLAQNVCIGATIPASLSLHRYISLGTHVQQFALSQTGLKVELHDNDIIAGVALTLTFCAIVSTSILAEFIILVLWPGRTSYPKWYTYTRITLPVIGTVGLLVTALVNTIVLTRSAFITGAPVEIQEQYISVFSSPPLKYSSYPANVVCVCFLWIEWVCAVAATIFLILGVRSEMNVDAEPTKMPLVPIRENDKPVSEFSG
ncbi:hypothetical protein J3R30DRAFT_1356029 [Lentinula aciculospora]|uniref:Uncharacterized protein n=1 Tax=Lentinula aciculospora TaxID=153920 RepID=A0A9W9AL52_9AGAR|nr:hypothetical protein J3R30DRAFT_1356029 [Lentinula aciculospora]